MGKLIVLTGRAFVQRNGLTGSPDWSFAEPGITPLGFEVYRAARAHRTILSLRKIERRGPEPRENPIDVAHRLARMLDQKVAASPSDLARRLGVSRARVSQYLALLRLDEQIQQELRAFGPIRGRRGITERQLRAIAKLPSRHEQLRALRQFLPRDSALVRGAK